MPTVTVKVSPVQGRATIFRISGRYGIMADGYGSVTAWRQYPWDFLVHLEPFIDGRGNLWIPETPEARGMAERDTVLHYRYINMGPCCW